MSRTLIEYGLPWKYRPAAILREIVDDSTNVAVANLGDILVGFGIMNYYQAHANLSLLAVKPEYSGRGFAKQLIEWLEEVARNAGVGWVHVQSRCANTRAQALYRGLGYHQVQIQQGYYTNGEACTKMAKSLAKVIVADGSLNDRSSASNATKQHARQLRWPQWGQKR